ncbi:NusG domain II-containing protein [Mesoaciditoga sp.]
MKNHNVVTKRDILILLVIFVGLIGWASMANHSKKAAKAVIIVHSKVYKVVNLNEDKTFKINWKGKYLMTVQIKNGAIRAKDSTCKNKICVHTGWISKDGQSIVCVPNHIIIYTEGAKPASCDLMTTQ